MLVNSPCWVILVTHSLVLPLTITKDRAHELQVRSNKVGGKHPFMPAARNYFTYPVSPVVKLYLKNTYYFKKGEQMSGYLS